jgi:hypothetical protein
MVFIKEKTSGYLGKKAVFGFSTVFSLSREPQHASTNSNYGLLGLNKAFGVSLQYAISNHSALRTAVFVSNTSASINDESVHRSDYPGWSSAIYFGDIYYNGSGYDVDRVSGRPKLSDKSFEFEYKYYRSSKGALAPIGAYFSGGLGIHNIETDLSDITIQASNKDWREIQKSYTIKYKNPIENKMLVEFYAKMGYGIVVQKFLLVDFNLRAGYMPPLLFSDASTLRSDIYGRLTRKQIINFELTLGVPL